MHGPHAGLQPGQATPDMHQARGVARRAYLGPVSRTARILSASIAVDTSGFFTANVPPNPQHESASRQLHQLDAAYCPQQL